MVAVHNETATTALSDVDECHTNKRKRRRSIVADRPFLDTWNKDIIKPTRCVVYIYMAESLDILVKHLIRSSATMRRISTLEVGPSTDAEAQRAVSETKRRGRLFGGLFGIRA